MGQQQKKGKGLPKRATTNKGRCAKFYSYIAGKDRAERKLRRVLRSSGPAEAARWAKEHGHKDILGGFAKYDETSTGERAKKAMQIA